MSLLQTFIQRYAVGEATAVAPYVAGSRVLDLGAGEGYVGAALVNVHGLWVCSTDVGQFRRVPGPYVIYDGIRLPFVDDAFDTTLTLLTLHHCEHPELVLDEAVRVTRGRLIVMESVYRNGRERFWLDLLDHRLNHYRHHGAMSGPVSFRRPEEWARLFESRELRTIETVWLGPWWERPITRSSSSSPSRKIPAPHDRERKIGFTRHRFKAGNTRQKLNPFPPMPRRFDHVDLRVRNLAEARPFYEVLLPALGFTRDARIEGWLQYETERTDEAPEFVGVTESPQHIANDCRIAFSADSIDEVDRLAVTVVQAGARNVEGPLYEAPDYYAVFFEDASGNRLEICYRQVE